MKHFLRWLLRVQILQADGASVYRIGGNSQAAKRGEPCPIQCESWPGLQLKLHRRELVSVELSRSEGAYVTALDVKQASYMTAGGDVVNLISEATRLALVFEPGELARLDVQYDDGRIESFRTVTLL